MPHFLRRAQKGDRMKIRALISVAIVVTVVVAAAVAVSLSLASRSAQAAAPGGPLPADQVPTVLPAEGALVDPGANIILMPAALSDAASLTVSTADAAIATAPAVLASGTPTEARALLAYVTIEATVPQGDYANGPWRTIQNRLCWTVTFTYPEAVMAVSPQSGLASPPPDAWKSHFNAIIDAQTGDLVWGFFSN